MSARFQTPPEVRAVWEECIGDPRYREMAHHRGVGKFRDDDVWLAIGRQTRARLRAALRVHRPAVAAAFDRHDPRRGPFFAGAALEWGPGGGSNVLALAPYVRDYYGVDVSGPTLAEASRQAEAAGITSFRPVHLDGEPEDIVQRIDRPVELVVSTAVFQHFPSAAYGRRVLRTMHAVTRPGSLGLVQIRYDDGKPRFRPKSGDYREHFITYTSYRLDAFASDLMDAGFRVLDIHVTNPGINYAFYVFDRTN